MPGKVLISFSKISPSLVRKKSTRESPLSLSWVKALRARVRMVVTCSALRSVTSSRVVEWLVLLYFSSKL